MKKTMINFVAVLIIGIGGLSLSQPMTAQAFSQKDTCKCKHTFADGSSNSSTCTGDTCHCNDDGTCATGDTDTAMVKIARIVGNIL